MTTTSNSLPEHYRDAARVLIRFAIVMAIVGLLSGVLYQESQKKLAFDAVGRGARLHGTLHLALVHGHILVLGTILPIAMAGLMLLGLKIGGAPLATRTVKWLTRGFLPFAALTTVLMLYKGYHFLLQMRGGVTDLAAIDAAYFGGVTAARYAVYGVVHTAMAVSLGVFLVGVWRSLPRK